MLPRDSQDVERRQVSRLPSGFYIQLLSHVTDEFSFAALRRKHSGQKKQIARLDCFRIGAERLRWRRKLDTKLLQPLLGAGWARAFAGHHLPTCAPPSTCSTSPVIWRASVR